MSEFEKRLEVMEQDKLYEYLLITALEGGSNYWVNTISTRSYSRMLKEGFILTSEDCEYRIIPEDYNKSLLQLKERYGKIYQRIVEGTYDANDADAWLQMMVFNEIIYG